MPKIPGVNHLDAVRALEKAGFQVVRQGKHLVMSNGTRIVTIPRHNPVNAFTMGGIARDAGLPSKSSATFSKLVTSPNNVYGLLPQVETKVRCRRLESFAVVYPASWWPALYEAGPS